MSKSIFAISAVALASLASPAWAGAIVCAGTNCVPNPRSVVLIDDDQSGFSIAGNLGAIPGTITFSSSEMLKSQGSGLDRVLAFDNSLTGPLTIAYSGALGLSALEINFNTASSGFVTFAFSGGDSAGVTTSQLALNSGNQNFYNAHSGTFSSVMLTFSGGASITDVRSIRVTAVPEPATWGLMLVGFGAAGIAIRRKAKVRAQVRFV